ncbi:MAG: sensor histidine kinase [Epsilonproteobacteria bacterium]|nr:sensor histidine kinase [Campylobacterota bacterium]
MKTFVMILTLFLSTLIADEKPIFTEALTYKTADKNITIETISNYDTLFIKADENTTFDDVNNTIHWIKLKLRDDLKSGTYIAVYGYVDFDLSSFSPKQSVRKFKLHGSNHISFEYKKGRDTNVYYVRLLPITKNYPIYLQVASSEHYYIWLDSYLIYLLIAGIVLGLMLMAAIYNGALYSKTNEKSFLYYALMQTFMVSVLFYHTGMPNMISPYLVANDFIYEYLSLTTALFGVLFTRSFLNTKQYLPTHDKILFLYLFLIILDMLLYIKPILSDYNLYSLTTAYFLLVGFLRMRQGFKPARFFLIGWSALMLGILVLEYFDHYAYFDTMLLGSAIEAIMLAIALAYKIKELQDEKEQQKELMIHQSKLASMGEMIGNIAHQWRQPLTHLSYIFMNLEEIEDKKARSKKVIEGTKQLEFMSQTIDDFRDFYAPDKEKQSFSLAEEIQNVVELINLKQIDLILDTKKDLTITNYKHEFKQVLLNLISNAKDALTLREIKSPTITITVINNIISVEDNAGGIDTENLHKIFEPYFSTKEKSSGIGLYMSKIIIEKNMRGALDVANSDKGALFTIKLPL